MNVKSFWVFSDGQAVLDREEGWSVRLAQAGIHPLEQAVDDGRCQWRTVPVGSLMVDWHYLLGSVFLKLAQNTKRRILGLGTVSIGIAGALALLWYIWRQPAEPVPFTDLNPYGANFFLAREVEAWKQEKTLEMAQAAGIGWIKQQFSWEEIEPHNKWQYEWTKYDHIVELAERYGMEVIARLDRPPDWTRENNQFKTRPPDNLNDYGDFVHAFVERYRGRVRYLQIWNEPNLSAEWGFQRVDAVAYVRMLKVAYQRAKEADPDIVVLSAPLAITLEDASMRGNHNDLIFLEQMYEAGAADYFDILSANAFGLDLPPEDPPSPNVLNFRRVELQQEIMARYGDGDKAVWLNEYGWNAPPASFPDGILTWERVTEAEQADFTVRGIAWAREHWPWLGVVNIWYFRQVGDVPPEQPAYYFAMVDPEFNPRPVYHAVRQATQQQGAAGAGVSNGPPAMPSVPVYLLASLCVVLLAGGMALWRPWERRP